MSKQAIFTGAICVLVAGSLSVATANAESAKEFYSKTPISMIIGFNPGGTYNLYARLAARHLPKHIPGNPTIVPRNMPGVGSMKAANHIFKQAPRDGSVIGMLAQGIALQQVLKHQTVRYDASKFNWIGRLTNAVEVTVVWHTSPVRTIQDAMKHEVVIGATSARSSTDTNHKLMNLFAGTKFKMVLGYKGTKGSLLAMERGEVKGSLAVVQYLLVRKPMWLKEKKISVIMQYSQKRHPAFPNVPAMVEFGKTKEAKEILALYGSTAEVGRSLMAPPGVPADRMAALQAAFNAMVKDPAFIAEMKQRKMELDPLSGVALRKIVHKSFAISAKTAARAAAARQ